MAATSEDEIRRLTSRNELRRGYYGGVYGVGYGLGGGYYLNPDQFGYTTAQSGSAGGALSGDASGGGGDGGGGGAA